MKSYLITMLVMFAMGLVSNDEPPSDGVKAIVFFVRVGMIIWTISLLVDL